PGGQMMPLTASARVDVGSYHLVSSRPVIAYQFNPLEYQAQGGPPGKDWGGCKYSYTNDASLLFPTTAARNVYRVTAQRAPKGWNAWLAVTGIEEGTEVTIAPGDWASIAPGGGLPAIGADSSAKFSLDAGDVMEIVSPPDTAVDFSGAIVTSSKPIQLIA